MACEVKKYQVPAPSILILTVQGIVIRKILTFLPVEIYFGSYEVATDTEKPFLLRNMHLT